MLYRLSKVWLPIICSASLALQACVTTVPSMNAPIDKPISGPSNIYVSEVAQRVKCEVYLAIKDYLPPHRYEKSDVKFDKGHKYSWLANFATTAHLELILNNQGSLTPGVTFTSILPNAYSAAAGASSVVLGAPPSAAPTLSAIPQSFNFGVGGGVSSQAVRMDDVQFSISFAELVKEFDLQHRAEAYYKCKDGEEKLGSTAFLDSNLGLSEWIASALGPTECFKPVSAQGPNIVSDTGRKSEDCFSYLTSGKHPSAQAAGSPVKAIASITIKQPGPSISGAFPIPHKMFYINQYIELRKRIRQFEKNINGIDNSCYKRGSNSKIESYRDLYLGVKDDDERLDILIRSADVVFPEADIKDLLQKAADKINAGNGLLSAVKKALPDCQKVESDPPIDNLSHTVQFVVAANINATPSWSFARLKTAASPALAALTHNNTQTLSIVIGPPSTNTTTAQNESLKSTLRAVLTPQPF